MGWIKRIIRYLILENRLFYTYQRVMFYDNYERYYGESEASRSLKAQRIKDMEDVLNKMYA